jgi:hypothetical protein
MIFFLIFFKFANIQKYFNYKHLKFLSYFIKKKRTFAALFIKIIEPY